MNSTQSSKPISSYRQSLKERILETAMNSFAERGIKAVKMDDIANALSVSKRTLYEIYTNKEDLLFEGIKQLHRQKREELKRILDESSNVMDVILAVYRQKAEEFRQTNEVYLSLFGMDPVKASEGICAYCDEVVENGGIHDVSHLNLALITWKAANKNYHHKC